MECVLALSAEQYGHACFRHCPPWCMFRLCFRIYCRCTRFPHVRHGTCSLLRSPRLVICWLRSGLAGWLVVRSTRSIELISVSYWHSLYSTNPSAGGATHSHPLGLHPGESIRARRQALPLAVADASTPSAWNGLIHSLLPAGVYGGPRPAAWGRWRLGCVPPFVSSLISGSLGPSGATITVRRPAS